MSAVFDLQDPAAADGGARSAAVPLLLLALLGLSMSANFGSVYLELRPAYLLPLIAAWWASREGPAVALPIALLSLVPDVGVRIDFVSLTFGFSDTTCLIAAGVALAFAPGRTADAVATALRPGWRWPATVLGLVWIYAGADRSVQWLRGPGRDVSIDVLALPLVLLAWAAIDWRRLVGALRRPHDLAAGAVADGPGGLGAAALAGLTLLALALQLGVQSGGLWLRLGSPSASALVPAACFVAVLCGWLGAWRVVVAVGAVAALAQALAWTVGPASVWALGLRSQGDPAALFVQCGVAVMMARLLQPLRADPVGAAAPPWPRWVLVALALLAIFGVMPALQHGQLSLWGAPLWALAGLAFLGGRRWGSRGVVGVPLVILALAAAVSLAVDLRVAARLASDLPVLGSVLLMHALAGWLALRGGVRDAAAGAANVDAHAGLPARLDISAVARVVQAVDQAAALRAFWALLVPALVLWQLAGLGVLVDVGLHMDADEDEPLPWGWIAMIGTLLALWPLSFVLLDWIDRQDRFRWLSGVTGGLLAGAGAALVMAALGFALPEVLEDAPDEARFAVVAVLLLAAGATAAWLHAASPARRRWARAGVVLLALLVLASLAGLVVWVDEDQRWMAAMQLGAGVVTLLVLAAWWVRAIRLRLVLCEDHPRALLMGALPAGRFWVRIGALLGLPASMWTGAALRQPATWAFLLARPVVYLGAALANATWPAAVLLVAGGHALFAGGKRLAARAPWRPQSDADPRAPVLFLRSFEDDQFDFRRPWWQWRTRWFDLWSFRRNLDETMVDEIAHLGPVVALGRPGEGVAPFGAQRHYADHADWQDVVLSTARRACSIVLVAGESPGLRWEFDMLRREQLLERTLLLLHPDPAREASNRRAIGWLLGADVEPAALDVGVGQRPVALWPSPQGPRLLTVDEPTSAAYVAALRAHVTQCSPRALASVVD